MAHRKGRPFYVDRFFAKAGLYKSGSRKAEVGKWILLFLLLIVFKGSSTANDFKNFIGNGFLTSLVIRYFQFA